MKFALIRLSVPFIFPVSFSQVLFFFTSFAFRSAIFTLQCFLPGREYVYMLTSLTCNWCWSIQEYIAVVIPLPVHVLDFIDFLFGHNLLRLPPGHGLGCFEVSHILF